MLSSSDRIILKQNKKKENENSLNVSFASNNSFYQKLNDDTKKDIIFLIKSGYDKRTIIKLYILAKPLDVNQAIHYLSKDNGIFRHIYFPSVKSIDTCEICGERQNMHIKNNNELINNYSHNSSISFITKRIEVIQIKKVNKIECKICEELSNENLVNKCEQCLNYFCFECLYLYIKELKGKSEINCPNHECNEIYNKKIIEEILTNSGENKDEIKNLKMLLEKNISKNLVLSNQDLMFCPIVDCQGYAHKNNNKNYNICNLGHKFCSKCGESLHKSGNCPEEEKVDKLFREYTKKYKLKECPFCHIITLKKGGFNHITGYYCRKNWCWLCQKGFESTDEHYGNVNSRCYNQMMNNIEEIICSNCGNFTNSYKRFKCEHVICKLCFEQYLLENDIITLNRTTKIKCLVEECNIITRFKGELFIDFIREMNNENLIQKYNKQILFYEYNFCDYFINFLERVDKYYYYYLFKLFDKIGIYFYRKYMECKGYIILEIIEIVFVILSVAIYSSIFPVYFHILIKKLYSKFLKESIKKYNYKLIKPIFIGENLYFYYLL